MHRFTDLTIRKKITIILMGTSIMAVLVACLTFYTLILNSYHRSYQNDLVSLSKVIGSNCQAALTFDIPEDAEKTLASLENRPSVISVTIHDNTGKLFAAYGRTLPESHGSIAADSDNKTMSLNQEITLDGNAIGSLSIKDDMGPILDFRKMAMTTLFIIITSVLALTFLLATRLRNLISDPISELAALSNRVSLNQDYSLRAVKQGSDEVGNLVDTFNNMLDQIERRNLDLHESEQRFRLLVDQAVDAFFLQNSKGQIIDVNQQACNSLGYSREELIGMTVADIDAAVDNKLFKEKYWDRLLPGRSVTIEGIHQRKDGVKFPVEVRLGLLDLDGKKIIMALARDITDRIKSEREKYRLETQLQQARKMESIGTLAGGIAHDFNNILSPIFGYVELTMMSLPEGSEVTSYLDEVMKAAQRAKELVKQILTFSRQEAQDKAPVQIEIITKEALKLLRASIPTTIEIRQDIASDCGPILANPTQIHQILMNLCTNAYHAMRETGGILGVSLKTIEINDKDTIRNINLAPGSYLRLEVSDTGPGMEQEIITRIFEPYFTTKAKGEGTGMGLSVVHGIIKGHDGEITVYSEPGKGTTFHVYLPVTKDATAVAERKETNAPLPTGREKILLVDDEKIIVKVVQLMLESLGYTVTAFTDPAMALEHFRENPAAFDLLLTDMTMPKMTGDQLIRQVIAIRPEFPIILCTGFSEIINEESAKEMGVKEYLMKPVVMNELAPVIRTALGDA